MPLMQLWIPHLFLHGLSTGDLIQISGVGGMVEVNDPSLQPYRVTVLTPTTFEINVDSSLWGVYTGGGTF